MPLKGNIHIRTTLKRGKTVVEDCFFTPPFKVTDITESRDQPEKTLMIMNASPGVLDGDVYALDFHIGAGTSLRLCTQSYQRLFRMRTSASLAMQVNIEKDASFCFIPHPTVPHKLSDFTSRNRINLSPGCTLYWGEVVSSGRNLHGESFSFTRYHGVTEICMNGKLIVKENLLMVPGLMNLAGIGQLEGYTHQATFIAMANQEIKKEMMQEIQGLLAAEENIEYGCTAIPGNGFLVRMLGYQGEQLFDCLHMIYDVLNDAAKKNIGYAI